MSKVVKPKAVTGRPSSRARFLAAGVKLMAQGKLFTLEDVAQEAGGSKGGVLYHFPNREALMMALFNATLDEMQRGRIETFVAEILQQGSGKGGDAAAYAAHLLTGGEMAGVAAAVAEMQAKEFTSHADMKKELGLSK